MDVTTLAVAILVALGLLATDTVLHSGSVAVEVAAPLNVYRDVIDQGSLESAFTTQLDRIAATVSVVNPPEIRSSSDEGIGMTLAASANVRPLAFAMQRQFGYASDRLRLSLLQDKGTLRGVVSGYGHNRGTFSHDLIPEKDEKLVTFIERCATWGASQLARYSTGLYLLQRHAGDGDFRDVEALASSILAGLPPAPVNEERAEFENLLGLVALFRNDPHAAQKHFEIAVAAGPDDPVPTLNLAFTEIQLDANEAAAARVRALLANMPSTFKVVQASAHMTLAAALLGMHDFDGADAELAKATALAPNSSAIPELWAEVKETRGDHEAANRLRQTALFNTTSFENFGEMAVLYFHLSWKNNEPVTRSKFSNPAFVEFH